MNLLVHHHYHPQFSHHCIPTRSFSPRAWVILIQCNPSLRMPYLEAMVNEVMRISSLVNLGVQHMANTNTELGGYTIPKVSFHTKLEWVLC